ncbi:MAG: D-alanine--D-alanine ligase [Pedosphaera sp.]|nr:D-alanine--D-alanine ligase [Pedosphaera sp.]
MSSPLIITVLKGGPSAERDVSLRSGAAVTRSLRSLGYLVYEVDPLPGDLRIPKGTQAVFLALHGTYGEDGAVQSELEELGLPYTGCGVAASLFAFDKVITKRRCLIAGLPTARFEVFNTNTASWPLGWHLPAILKPTRQGSSVGLHFINVPSEFPHALTSTLHHGGEALLEEQILGREITVAVLGETALPIVEVRPKTGAYDYSNKYTPGCTDYFCPAEFDTQTMRTVQEVALRAFSAIGGRDYGRIDMIVQTCGSPVILEVNTLPGMTETSLFPKAAAAAGIDFPSLCQQMLEMALNRSVNRSIKPL